MIDSILYILYIITPLVQGYLMTNIKTPYFGWYKKSSRRKVKFCTVRKIFVVRPTDKGAGSYGAAALKFSTVTVKAAGIQT